MLCKREKICLINYFAIGIRIAIHVKDKAKIRQQTQEKPGKLLIWEKKSSNCKQSHLFKCFKCLDVNL